MNAQAATATPQTTSGGFPSMQVVRALAAAAQRVREVECAGKSLDPRDPYAYARADDLVAAAKEALNAEGLLVLPAGSDEKPEPVAPNVSVIWLRQTFNVVHVESGEWLPFQADPWPLHRDKPLDKAMATAKTASKAYFYLSLLEIRRVGPNAEDMDADVPPEAAPAASKPVTDSTAIGVSSRSKQSAAGARMSRQNEERNREKVDPEALKAELDQAAREAFGGDEQPAPHVDPDPTMPPANAICVAHGVKGCAPCWGDELNPAIKDSGASSPEPASVGTVPAEAPQPDKGNGSTSPPAACKSGPESTPSATSTDGATNTTSGAGESLPPSSSSPAPEGLTETKDGPPELTAEQIAKASAVLDGGGTTKAAMEAVGASLVLSPSYVTPSGARFSSGSRGNLWAMGPVRWWAKTQAVNKWLRGQRDEDEPEDVDATPLVQPTPSQVKAVDLLSKRVAESRAGKWARSKEREARKAFLCAVCQPSVPDGGPPAEWEPAIRKGDKHRDGEKAGRCCLKCYERLMAEAEPVKEGA